MLVCLQIVRYNYDNKLNNSKAIATYNEYSLQQSKYYSLDDNTKSIKNGELNCTENDFIQFFFQEDRKILNFKGLLPVFLLYGYGILFSLLIFVIEILYSHHQR